MQTRRRSSGRRFDWSFWFVYGLVLVTAFAAYAAFATEPKPATQQQAQEQSAASSSVSGGGASSANLYSSERARTIAVGTTAPAPLHATPACYLPAKGVKRVRQALFGVVTLDPRLVRDEQCMNDVVAAREHELAVLQAQVRLEESRARRLALEREGSCADVADRALAACVSK